MSSSITIPKKLTKGADLVVIPKVEYEQMQRHVAEVDDALEKIRRGEAELRDGKTKATNSLKELE